MRSFLRIFFIFISLLFVGGVNASPIDINHADAVLIAKTLNGIGQKKAEQIVTYRAKNGPFKTVDELTKVKGIGKKTVDKNRKNIRLSGKYSGKMPVKTVK
jgi:competence protein ComEA